MNDLRILQETASSSANAKQTTARVLKTDFVIVLLLLGIVIASWLPRMHGPIDLRWDGSVYYVLGTALAEGSGYRLLNEPGEIEAVQYPPLLPAIVAAHQLVLGTDNVQVVGPWLRTFFFVLSIGFVLSVYWLVRQYLTAAYALLATCITWFYMYTFYLSDVLYADLPFALVSTLFAIVHRQSTKPAYNILSVVLAVSAYLLRTAGIALLAAWVTESLVRGRFRQAIARAGIALIPILLWGIYVVTVTRSEEYRHPAYAYQRAAYQYNNVTYAENYMLIDPFRPELGKATVSDLLTRIKDNLVVMPEALGEAVSATLVYWNGMLGWFEESVAFRRLPLWIVTIFLVLIGTMVIVGMILLAKIYGEVFIPLYAAFSIGLLCLTPLMVQFNRYLAPLTPFLALALVSVLANVQQRRPSKLSALMKPCMLILLGLIVVLQFYGLGTTYGRMLNPVQALDARGYPTNYRLFFYFKPWQELDKAFQWLRQQDKGIIATSVPHMAYLSTGFKAVLAPLEKDSQIAQIYLDSVPVKYVVLDIIEAPQMSQQYVAPVIKEHSALWKRIYTVPGGETSIYERVH